MLYTSKVEAFKKQLLEAGSITEGDFVARVREYEEQLQDEMFSNLERINKLEQENTATLLGVARLYENRDETV
jgi:hemerythrin superfamily protein